MNLPQKDYLSQEDWKKSGMNLLLFLTPAILAFLAALQTGGFSFAFGAGYTALLISAGDLYGRYKSGIDPTYLPYIKLQSGITEEPTVIQPDVQQTTTTTNEK